MNKKNDQAMSSHIAARVDGLRFYETDLASLDDEALRQLDSLFREHMKTIETLILQINQDEIVATLAKTFELIRKHYIIPIESEMARRWRNAE